MAIFLKIIKICHLLHEFQDVPCCREREYISVCDLLIVLVMFTNIYPV